jgi:uncharacterized protein (DUF1499 family)
MTMSMVLSRRRAVPDPPSWLAILARRLAVFALAVALLAIIFERADVLEIVPLLVTFGGALLLSLFAIFAAFAAFVSLWMNGGPGFGQAMTAVLIGVGLIGYPTYLVYKGYSLPPIRDITTDPIDPPRFDVVARLRPPNSSVYPGLATAEIQKETWPDIEPLVVNVNPKIAFDNAYAIITKRKWRIVDARAPQPGRDGRIEAIARSQIMGFRDDVAIRIRGIREGSRIDIRSASRYSFADFGANAERVLGLLDDIDDASTVDKADVTERAAKSAPKAAPKGRQSTKR